MRLHSIFKANISNCENTNSKTPLTEKPKPQSMLELIDSKLSSSTLQKTAAAFSEPGTYYGFAAGACTGFALKKVAKAAALTFGAVFIGFQLAAKSQYVTVNWEKIEGDLKKYIPDRPDDESQMITETVQFLTTNTGIATAVFTTGFVTGLRMG